MSMSSFFIKEWGGRGIWGEGSNRHNGACGNEAVDSQHGTGMGGSSHPHTKSYYPK